MSVGIRQNLYQPVFRGNDSRVSPKNLNSETTLGAVDLDKIPGVDTVNTTITDMANEGKVCSRKALNIVMTIGLGVAAFFTGKRISKSVLDSVCNHTVYLDSVADFVRRGFEICAKPLKNINPEKGNAVTNTIRKGLYNIPQAVKNFARTGLHRDIELEKYAKSFKTTVDKLNSDDLLRFEAKYTNTIVKNGISKLIAGTIGLVTGFETFVEVGADKNKNGIPDLFEQKSYKEIMDIAQPKFDEKVIEQVRKINVEDEDGSSD